MFQREKNARLKYSALLYFYLKRKIGPIPTSRHMGHLVGSGAFFLYVSMQGLQMHW